MFGAVFDPLVPNDSGDAGVIVADGRSSALLSMT